MRRTSEVRLGFRCILEGQYLVWLSLLYPNLGARSLQCFLTHHVKWLRHCPPHPTPDARVAYPYTYIRECPLCSDIIVIPVQTSPILMFPDFLLAVAFLPRILFLISGIEKSYCQKLSWAVFLALCSSAALAKLNTCLPPARHL